MKTEILAPAGSIESIYPAVRMGADAVYIGSKLFSARKGAVNFSEEELKCAVDYCHAHDVKVYLTLNTTLHDSELEEAEQLIKRISLLNTDAVIVQDMGVAELIKQISPQLRLHASTQMTVHTPAGAKALYSAGFSRIVLARELTKAEIKEIIDSCPIETEVFVHGALCMCVSGQCYFSAMLGSRSGNRGQCAQPCRLPFGVNGIAGNALSLKDNSLIEHIGELAGMGVTSLKIEGRMKRPEYVAAAVNACRIALDTGVADIETLGELESVFSRQGFTDGYFADRRGREMFGVRTKDDVTAATEKVFSAIRQKYKDEQPKIPVNMALSIRTGERIYLSVSDESGNTATAYGEIPQEAINVPINEQKCRQSLEKTGGTPYFSKTVNVELDDNLSVPASQLNKLRREALELLTEKRTKRIPLVINDYKLPERKLHTAQNPVLRAVFKHSDVPDEFAVCDLAFVPYYTPCNKLGALQDKGINVGIEIPRVIFGAENDVRKKLSEARNAGVSHVLAHTQDAILIAQELGMKVHGGFGLNITNTLSAQWAAQNKIEDIQLSCELNLKQIEEIGGDIKRGVCVYGYLPLMICRNCPAKYAGFDCKSCKKQSYLTDRKDIKQRLFCNGITTEVLNAVPTVMTDRLNEIKNVDFHIMEFYVENHVEIVKKLRQYQEKINVEANYTRGLYYRGVL